MKRLFLIFLLLLPLATAQDYADKVYLEDGKITVEGGKVSFFRSLFSTPQQSVLESTVKSKVVSGNQEVIATLFFESKKYNAEAYKIHVYYYDTNTKKHTKEIYTYSENKPLPKKQIQERTFILGQAKDFLTQANENHYIGVVGVLQLKVPKAQLSPEDLTLAYCSGESCEIYEKYNTIGGIGTIAFNPVFFYSVPQTSRCADNVGYTGKPHCDGNKVYQDYVNRDCTKTDRMVKNCLANECSAGACIKTACPYTGELVSQSCVNGQLQQKIYDSNCQIITNTVALSQCDEPIPISSGLQAPAPEQLEVPTEPLPCVPVTEDCADGSSIELFSCPDLQPTSNICPSTNLPATEEQPTVKEKEPSPAEEAESYVKRNFGMIAIAITLALIAIALIIRRYKK